MNPLASIRWKRDLSSNLQIQAIYLPKSKKIFKVSNLVLDILNYCLFPRSKNNIRNYLTKEKIDSGFQKIFEDLTSQKILVDYKNKDYSIWLKMGWRNALYFHLFTKDIKYFDMGQVGEEKTKSKVLSDYVKLGGFPKFFKEFKKSKKLPLPEDFDNSLGHILLNRRTKRAFPNRGINISKLATLLYYSTQPAKVVRNFSSMRSKNNPLILTLSSYTPFEVYFVVFKVSGIKNGIYHYNMRDHSIHLIKKGNFSTKITKIGIGQKIKNSNLCILISSDFGRYMWRYRDSRALRNVYIECSSLAHRIILTAEALDLGCFLTPALRDTIADEFLKIDGFNESVTYLLTIGNKW
ncbi:MAG: SagB/ThcOx family dehydrogenase [Candidatus Micrarchaeota archaeon]|nr:SagB/ThcOx family dehydrogenase [Candidatus Micrarchaeota archaeon]